MIADLLIATRNPGKIEEITSLLGDIPIKHHFLSEFVKIAEVDETGTTYEENAELKARAYASATRLWSLADDSGLEVDGLDGAPGVLSARFSGAGKSDADRVNLLIAELASQPGAKRSARFVCAISIASPTGDGPELFKRTCEGVIAPAAVGCAGFGYDPVFIPAGYRNTFGELPPKIKNTISHRAKALRAAREFILSLVKLDRVGHRP